MRHLARLVFIASRFCATGSTSWRCRASASAGCGALVRGDHARPPPGRAARRAPAPGRSSAWARSSSSSARCCRPAATCCRRTSPTSWPGCRTACRRSRPRVARAARRAGLRQAASRRCSPASTPSRSPAPRSRRCTSRVLKDGREVAVKVLRPGMLAGDRRRPGADAHAGALGRARCRSTASGSSRARWSAEFDNYLHDELDLVREAANAAQLRRNMQGLDLVLVPEMVWDSAPRTCIVMERMNGVPISQRAAPARRRRRHHEAGPRRRHHLLHPGVPRRLLPCRHAPGQHPGERSRRRPSGATSRSISASSAR